jgi:secondary thiamine-phosphate synthase enzyme
LIATKTFEVQTDGENDIVNLTKRLDEIVRSLSNGKDAMGLVFVQSSTSAITTLEYENGLLADIPSAMERIAPRSAHYEHEQAWHDGNGHSHVRSSLVGTSFCFPIQRGKLMLGRWQQIVLMEFDIRPRTRTLVVQLVMDGETKSE